MVEIFNAKLASSSWRRESFEVLQLRVRAGYKFEVMSHPGVTATVTSGFFTWCLRNETLNESETYCLPTQGFTVQRSIIVIIKMTNIIIQLLSSSLSTGFVVFDKKGKICPTYVCTICIKHLLAMDSKYVIPMWDPEYVCMGFNICVCTCLIYLSVSPAPLCYCCSLKQTNRVARCLSMRAAAWKPCPTMFLHNFGHRRPPNGN